MTTTKDMTMNKIQYTQLHIHDLQDPRTRAAAMERERAAERIDPQSCERWFNWVDMMDPSGEDPDPDRETCIGRSYFLAEPDRDVPVDEHHVRLLHPEISESEWKALMAAATTRWYKRTGCPPPPLPPL
jgi:hypothetical protein